MSIKLRKVIALLGVAAVAAPLGVVAGPGAASAAPLTGTLRITVTEPDGSPARGAVIAFELTGLAEGEASLDQAGVATIELPPAPYKLKVIPSYQDSDELDHGRAQYVPGKQRFVHGAEYQVTAGAVTQVAERLLDPGSVTVTARNSVDGSPVTGVCARTASRELCADGSQVTLTGLLPGPVTVTVSDTGGRYLPRDLAVSVPAGGAVALPVELTPAATLVFRVVDRATGQPVANACAGYAPAGTGRLRDGVPHCSDATGRITIGQLAAGAYQLFVQPAAGSTLGAQWVGATGGTGDVASARTVTLTAGRTVEVPTVRLDPAGTVTGLVTSTGTGQPVTSGEVSLVADGRPEQAYATAVDAQGRYRLAGLGPYRWPLYFTTYDHAWQWSGGVPERSQAQQVQVRAGRSVTLHQTLLVGTALSGQITNPTGASDSAELTVHSATTGEVAAYGYFGDGSYRLLVLGPRQVKIEWWWRSRFDSTTGWYDGALGFADATPVTIPQQGTATANITVHPA